MSKRSFTPEQMEGRRVASRAWARRNPGQARRSQWWGGIKYRYGLTQSAYLDLLIAQEHACALCRRPFGRRTPDVDHCHVTDRVRGLLCRACNIGLGLLGESSTRLRAAALYLDTTQVKEA